eukprot:scaffold626_cov128-Isochrysis_galbana.AAC.4
MPLYTGYEGKRLEGPCPHQSSEQLVDEDNRGHHNPPPAGRWALDAPGRGQGGRGVREAQGRPVGEPRSRPSSNPTHA